MGSTRSLLCVCNYQANTGYAWDFIEGLFAALADHLAPGGIRTLVAYPSIPSPPKTLEGHAAEAVQLNVSLTTTESIERTADLVRRERVEVIYFVDRPVCSWAYARLRGAGAQRIIVHDHSSGARNRPRGMKKLAKWVVARLPRINADVVVAVSDYVSRRQREVGMVPAERVVTIWNSLPIPSLPQEPSYAAHDAFGLVHDRPLIMCSCRATREKGVDVLLRAFEHLLRRWPEDRPRPALIYFGEGPAMTELRALRDSLASSDDVILAGFRRDAVDMVNEAAVCVVPSVWDEAFCLAALECMLRAKPVVATRSGAIPELLEDGVTGLLVDRGDASALAAAIGHILMDPALASRLGTAARQYAVKEFNRTKQLQKLKMLVGQAFKSG